MKKQILSLIFVISSFIAISQSSSLMYASTSNTNVMPMQAYTTAFTPTITVMLNDTIWLTNVFNWLNGPEVGGAPGYIRLVNATTSISATSLTQVTTNIHLNFKANTPGTSFYKFVDGALNDISYFYVTTMIPTGIANLSHININKLTVFPNPATDEVTVAFNASKEKTNVEVFDIQGRLVFIDTEEREIGINKIKLNTSSFSAGIYIIRAGSETFKITKI